LLVDDDADTRRWLAEYLADLDYETHVAVDGEHALRSAVALRPDLILLDIYLPEPSAALRFAERYRERVPADRRAPIVAMSGSDRLQALGQQIGADEIVPKPFEMSALVKVLTKYLDEPVDAPATEAVAAEVPAVAPDPVRQPESGAA
jgi:CheY-like chemotaxis protein